MRFKYCKNCKYLFYNPFGPPLFSGRNEIYAYGGGKL